MSRMPHDTHNAMDADATDGLLDELLSLLDDEPSEQQCEPLTQQPQTHRKSRKAQAATTAPLRGKRQLEQLQREAELLSQQLGGLRLLKNVTASETQARAMSEKYKRRRAEQECEQLRLAVYTHAQFLRGLRSIFAPQTPPMLMDLNLCHCLHSYTRLPIDQSARLGEYAALAQERRVRIATEMLWRETQAIASVHSPNNRPSLESPRVYSEMLQSDRGFGVTTASVFAIDALDLGAVVRSACFAVRDIFLNGPSYRCVAVRRTSVEDPEASASAPSTSSGAQILYRVIGTHLRSRQSDDELSIETRLVTLCRHTTGEAIMMWDFVDDDELHPTMETTDITRESVGAFLVRRELCDDGVLRPVCRFLFTRFYRFHDTGNDGPLRRYEAVSDHTKSAYALELRRIMAEEVAKEEELYVDALIVTSKPPLLSS